MKKVAIMTWYNYYNFGTALQVTALSKVINNLGYEASVINYTPHEKVISLNKNYKDIKLYANKINKKLKMLKNREVADDEKKYNFKKFIDENIKLTDECMIDSQLYNLNCLYDAFVCGSDQIWAPSCFNSKYFLDFVENPQKMISYAPSIGLSEIKDIYIKNRMKECISRFEYLSIREEQGKVLIRELCDRQAEVVLDPTLLLTSEQWDEIADKPRDEDKYILCYFLGNNKDTWAHVNLISKEMGLKIKILPVFKKDYSRGFEVVKGAGPSEFLGLLKNASFVCTDSFHGTLFSIIYNRPFFTYERFSNKDNNSQNSRIYNILSITNLEGRLVKDKKQVINNLLECDFKDAISRLDVKRKESLQYLEQALYNSTSINSKDEFIKVTNTCCGCGVCSTVCGKNAIDIKLDNNGFIKSFIDVDKCVKCGLCKKVCPFNGVDSTPIDKDVHKLFMMKSKDKSVLEKSASGGIAYEISKELCGNGYDIVGCVYDNNEKKAVHRKVNSGKIEEIKMFQGAKYIQSNTIDTFNKIYISDKKTVIFGTPCQISGINRILKLKDKRNQFILVDLICHGIPTYNLWSKYLSEVTKKYGYKLNCEVNFRDKSKGWREKYITIGEGKIRYTSSDKKDLFYRFFEKSNCYCESCYECGYRTSSEADIRLGDYWGPRYKNDKEGVSMAIAMTARGEKLLQSLNKLNKVDMEQMNCSEYWTVQYPQNPIKPVFYNNLMDELRSKETSLDEIADKYCKEFEWYNNLNKIYNPARIIYKSIRKK